MNRVKRTERGWAGHFICSSRCQFRRNTLLEYEDKKLVVSTVGSYYNLDNELDTIAHNTYYETMVFEAILDKNGYIEANVTKEEIYPDNNCRIRADSLEELFKKYPLVDNDANDMHEKIVREMMRKLRKGDVL